MTKTTEPMPAGASPGYQIEERFPTPEPLPKAADVGALSPEQRELRIVDAWAKLTRGMANTSPARGDSLGPLWALLASEYEARFKELGGGLPAPTPDRPLELREVPVPVIPMAGPVQSSTDQLLAKLLDRMNRPDPTADALARVVDRLDKLTR